MNLFVDVGLEVDKFLSQTQGQENSKGLPTQKEPKMKTKPSLPQLEGPTI